MRSIVSDLVLGVRQWRRAPGFTAIALLALAAGIGVTATVFSVANALLLRPLSAGDAGRLVRVYSERNSNTPFSVYADYRARTRTLSDLAAFQFASLGVRAGDAPARQMFGELTSGNYFRTLRVQPAVGRLFGPGEDDLSRPARSVVLSHRLWRDAFAQDPAVIGRTIAVNGEPFEIVGVAPRAFTGSLGPMMPQLWVPFSAEPLLRPHAPSRLASRTGNGIHMIGRLADGVTRARAQAEFSTLLAQLKTEHVEDREWASVDVYEAGLLHPQMTIAVRSFMGFLMIAAGLLLVIACVNLATLLLMRGASRLREIGIRQALGVGRLRLVRQLLVEHLALAGAGGALGLALAAFAGRAIMAIPFPGPMPVVVDLSIDWRVAAFTAGLTALTVLLVGLAPALSAARVDVLSALRDGGGGRVTRSRLRGAFVVAQIAASALLLVAAGLAMRSFAHAQRLDVGMAVDEIASATFDPSIRALDGEALRRFHRDLVERLERSPGIRSAALVDIRPLSMSRTAGIFLPAAAPAPVEGRPIRSIDHNAVTPGYFETMGIGRLQGRDFAWSDAAGSPRVAILNEVAARRLWPDEDDEAPMVGRQFKRWNGREGFGELVEVVGVVRTSHYASVGEAPRAMIFFPMAQSHSGIASIVVRTPGEPARAVATMEAAVASLDRDLPLFDSGTMRDLSAMTLLPARVAGWLLSALGLVTLILAAVGLYAVVAFSVRQRRAELGIRIALGAPRHAIYRLVMRQGVAWLTAGLALGLGGAFAAARPFAAWLHGVGPADAATYVGVVVALGLVAALASLVPARAATRVDPIAIIKAE